MTYSGENRKHADKCRSHTDTLKIQHIWVRICEYLLTSTNVVAWPLLALKIRFELVVLHSALFVALHSVLFVALHSALFGSLLAYEYKSTCSLVQEYKSTCLPVQKYLLTAKYLLTWTKVCVFACLSSWNKKGNSWDTWSNVAHPLN